MSEKKVIALGWLGIILGLAMTAYGIVGMINLFII